MTVLAWDNLTAVCRNIVNPEKIPMLNSAWYQNLWYRITTGEQFDSRFLTFKPGDHFLYRQPCNYGLKTTAELILSNQAALDHLYPGADSTKPLSTDFIDDFNQHPKAAKLFGNFRNYIDRAETSTREAHLTMRNLLVDNDSRYKRLSNYYLKDKPIQPVIRTTQPDSALPTSSVLDRGPIRFVREQVCVTENAVRIMDSRKRRMVPMSTEDTNKSNEKLLADFIKMNDMSRYKPRHYKANERLISKERILYNRGPDLADPTTTNLVYGQKAD